MSNDIRDLPVIELRLQPPRSLNQKKRLARHMRERGATDIEIKRVCWHPENSPTKRKLAPPTQPEVESEG